MHTLRQFRNLTHNDPKVVNWPQTQNFYSNKFSGFPYYFELLFKKINRIPNFEFNKLVKTGERLAQKVSDLHELIWKFPVEGKVLNILRKKFYMEKQVLIVFTDFGP